MSIRDIIQLIVWAITIGGVIWKASSLASKIKVNEDDIRDLRIEMKEQRDSISEMKDAVAAIRESLASISAKLDWIIEDKKK